MKTSYKDVRVNTKLNEEDYIKLQEVCDRYGIKSIYEILQTLIDILARAVDRTRDLREEKGVPVELTEIVSQALEQQKRQARKEARQAKKR